MPDPRPFIIWTLQRTGGTHLTNGLVDLSGLPSTQHEPFNEERIHGQVTRDWIGFGDHALLDECMREIVRKGFIMKHCVEMVPPEISDALARISAGAGYRHLFLYRRNALDRLLSLHFARQTGVWGPLGLTAGRAACRGESDRGADGNAVAEDAFSEEIPVDELIAHERHCIDLLTRYWEKLREFNARPVAIAFEDVFDAADLETPLRALSPAISEIGLMENLAGLRSWVANLVATGGQGTKNRYRLFPGAAQLEECVRSLDAFSPNREGEPLLWRKLVKSHPWILHFVVDVLPGRVEPDSTVDLGGVLVLSREAPEGLRLKVRGRRGAVPLKWGIPSQRMAELHPQGRNSVRARWSASVSFASGEHALTFKLAARNGPAVVLGEVLRAGPDDFGAIHRESGDRLIFDIGANDGADAWYYLRKGFRVVAVEAIPELAKGLRNTFAAQIEAGRLAVEQTAVAGAPGEVNFTINEDRTEWSSAHGAAKAFGNNQRTLSVPATTMATLIGKHGAPYYVKIDIEGGEKDAVRSLGELPSGKLPPFLSVETNPWIFDVLQILQDLGYRQYQLVRQGAPYLPSPPSPSFEGLDYRCVFTSNMSGPFGLDLPVYGWVDQKEIKTRIIESQQEMKQCSERAQNPGWYDLHARRAAGKF